MKKPKKAVSPAPKRKAAPSSSKAAARAARAAPAASAAPAAQEAAPTPAAPKSLALAAECLVTDATSLKANLASLLDEPLPVTLDVTALQRIDTAALQVITAFVRERAGHGRPVEWQGTAPVLGTAAQLLGLTTLLKLPA
jgi:ABC-type transporter Mla MlaB component